MSEHTYRGLFVAEGSSDLPLADLVEALFFDEGLFDEGVAVLLSKPDFGSLPRVRKDVRSGCRPECS